MSNPSSKLSYHAPCKFNYASNTSKPFKKTIQFEDIHEFKGRGCKMMGKNNNRLPSKISTHATFFNLLQHLQPKTKYFCCNTKLLQYTECKSSIVVKCICNLHENDKHRCKEMAVHHGGINKSRPSFFSSSKCM